MVVAAPLIAVSAPLIALLWAMPAASAARRSTCVRRPPITVAVGGAHRARRRSSCCTRSRCGSGTCRRCTTTRSSTKACTSCSTSASSAPRRCSGGASRTAATAGAATARRSSTSSPRRVHGGVLGALLTFSPRVWYAPYLTQPSVGSDAARRSAARRPADVGPGRPDLRRPAASCCSPRGCASPIGAPATSRRCRRRHDTMTDTIARRIVARRPGDRRSLPDAAAARTPPAAALRRRTAACRARRRRCDLVADVSHGEWRMPAGDYGNLRYSTLDTINTTNVDEPSRRHDLLDRHSARARRAAAGVRQHDVRGHAVSRTTSSPST